MKVKFIEIDNQKYALPDEMSTKDIQALAGFVLTLRSIGYYYLFATKYNGCEQVEYVTNTPTVRLGTMEVTEAEEAAKLKAADQIQRDNEKAKAATA